MQSNGGAISAQLAGREAVRTVLAVRQFKSDPVPEEVVHQIIEAGHLTASSINGQPWHFIVVEDSATLQQLDRT